MIPYEKNNAMHYRCLNWLNNKCDEENLLKEKEITELILQQFFHGLRIYDAVILYVKPNHTPIFDYRGYFTSLDFLKKKKLLSNILKSVVISNINYETMEKRFKIEDIEFNYYNSLLKLSNKLNITQDAIKHIVELSEYEFHKESIDKMFNNDFISVLSNGFLPEYKAEKQYNKIITECIEKHQDYHILFYLNPTLLLKEYEAYDNLIMKLLVDDPKTIDIINRFIHMQKLKGNISWNGQIRNKINLFNEYIFYLDRCTEKRIEV